MNDCIKGKIPADNIIFVRLERQLKAGYKVFPVDTVEMLIEEIKKLENKVKHMDYAICDAIKDLEDYQYQEWDVCDNDVCVNAALERLKKGLVVDD